MRGIGPALGLLLAAAAAVVVVLLLDPFDRGAAVEPGSTPVAPSPAIERAPPPLAGEPWPPPIAERPEAPLERRPAEADTTPAPDEVVVLRVLDPQGLPLAAARVCAAREAAQLCDLRTDARGEVSFAADPGPAWVAVSTPTRAPQLFDCVLAPGDRELVLDAGERVAGRLVRDDGGSTAELRLRLDCDRGAPELQALPAETRAQLGLPQARPPTLFAPSGEDGAFAFSGLPAGWSGSLMLPGDWRVVASSEGELEPFARGVRLERAAAGLVLRVEQERSFRGRLLLRDGGAPLASASLILMTRSAETDDASYTSASVDDEGRFELSPGPERVELLDLRLGGSFRECPSLLRLEGAAIPADGGLGDLLVDDVRDVPFVLRDPGGAPIRRGRAEAGGVRSARTGADGAGVLRWVPRAVESLRAEAEGYVPAEVELPKTLAAPLVVVLEPANTLLVHVIPPPGGDPQRFKVVVRREEGVAAAPIQSQADQRAHVVEWDYPPAELWSAPRHTFLSAKPSAEDGVATFRALACGVELTLEVRPMTGEAVFDRRVLAPLAPGEERRVDVDVAAGLLAFRGRVVDTEGRGLHRASVQLGNQILDWTDEDGSFLGFVLPDQPPRTLVVQHELCSTLFLHDYAVPADEREVELRMTPARHVTIEVVDAASAPVPQAEVWIEQEGFTSNTHRVEGSRHVARSLTAEPFVILVRLAGREYRQEHRSTDPAARVVVPVHGSVRVTLSAATLADRAGRFTLVLVPLEDTDAGPVVAGRRAAPDLSITLPAVHPGRYAATLEYEPTDAERAAGRAEQKSPPMAITVSAGQQAEFELGLP